MKKILIISSNRLGDCILSSGLNKFFKEKYNDLELTFVCGEVPAQLFQYCNNIDKLIILEKKKYSLHWFKLWKIVFLNFWDIVIDLRGSLLSYTLLCKQKKIFISKKDIVEHKVTSISKLVTNINLPPNINLSFKTFKENKYISMINKLKKKIVIIAPGANWIGKVWPATRYCKILKKLSKVRKFSDTIFVVVGPEEEKEIMNDLLNDSSLDILNLVGKLNLVEIFLIMKNAKLFIGNDSGLMHLAALSNIPTVGIFGPSDPKKYSPWGKETFVIKSPKTPDELMGYKGFNSKKVDSLMLDLSVEFVYEKILSFYKKLK